MAVPLWRKLAVLALLLGLLVGLSFLLRDDDSALYITLGVLFVV